MLPYFMSNVFPAGTVGLVTAAILAASLSSVDAAIHSGSSVLVVDIYNRLIKGLRQDRAAAEAAAAQAENDRAQVRALRAATVLMGVMGTVLATNVESIGTLLEIANKLINSFSGPLFGIFLLAMFSTRATSVGALAGGLAGAAAAYIVAYRSPIGFLWPSTFGLAATLIVGVAASLVSRPPPAEIARHTWRGVMRRPDIL
jgi:SSS family solute:Na+ symporter